jgi:putative FmdB family regulatory protein
MMATYLYNCLACEEEKTVVKSMSDDSIQVCRDCGDAALKRVFTAPGISFVGSGFYSTDS